VSDELDKSTGEQEGSEDEGNEHPTVSPPFDPATFARDLLAKPSPARGTPAADPHTHATPPQGTAQQQAIVEMSRASKPPETKTADGSQAPEPSPDSIRSIAAQRLPSLELPRIQVPTTKKLDSFGAFNAVDREWADLEVATRPPPADAPDADPEIEISHEATANVTLDLDDIELQHQHEAPTAPTALVSEEPVITVAATTPEPSPPPPVSKKAPPTEEEMNDRISVGDYSGALEIAEAILAENPGHVAAKATADNCRTVLRKMYAARIGPLGRVPSVAVARDQLRWLSIDHKAGFVLSLVDGVSSLEMIIDVSGMPELDTLRILSELVQQRIISLR
jgi:hypothetical protein